jgi:DNA polymerase-3 subunit gamma/tau
MELYKKYRPTILSEMVGNKATIQLLSSFAKKGNLPHAIMFTGQKGCGKTTLGRILKTELNCADCDYKELDTGVFRGIDTVREIREQMKFLPIKSKVKLFLLDECHMIGRGNEEKNEAQNALLKALEDTPKHVHFILCTTNPERMISAVKSRCVEIQLQALTEPEMILLLKKVCKKEGKVLPTKVVKQIITYAEGSPRNALQLLEKALNLTDEKDMLNAVKSELLDQSAAVNELCQAMLKTGEWGKVRKVLQGLKNEDPESIRRQIIGYAGAVLLNGNDAASLILGWFLYKNTYDAGFPLVTQFCYNITQGIEPPC